MLRHSDLVTLRGAPPEWRPCSHCGGRPRWTRTKAEGKFNLLLKGPFDLRTALRCWLGPIDLRGYCVTLRKHRPDHVRWRTDRMVIRRRRDWISTSRVWGFLWSFLWMLNFGCFGHPCNRVYVPANTCFHVEEERLRNNGESNRADMIWRTVMTYRCEQKSAMLVSAVSISMPDIGNVPFEHLALAADRNERPNRIQ